MITPGTRVEFEHDGVTYSALISSVEIDTDTIETTIGGLFPGGPPPDQYRRFAQGRPSITATMQITDRKASS